MTNRINILGNGDSAGMFQRGTKGRLLVCNMPPFEITRKEVFATCMVDFKMMNALTKGEIQLDMYDWMLGNRPRKWMEMRPDFYLRYAQCIKGFYQHVPQYAVINGEVNMAATNFNCGHLAVHYACNKMLAEEVHLYGFDSLFDMNIRSFTDLLLESDRSANNTNKLANNWRIVWEGVFAEFKNVNFVLHHGHDKLKIKVGDHVQVETHSKKELDKTGTV